MALSFAQLCSCGNAGYVTLWKNIEACATAGQSYEFSSCRMPDGCSPARSTLGFWHSTQGYLLYLRPAVHYAGAEPSLARFFSRDRWLFPDFPALAQALSSFDHSSTSVRAPLYRALSRVLSAQIVGQDEAVESTAFKLYGHISKRLPRRPLSLIFYGPTGVGKSELAKAIAPALCQCTGQSWQTVWTELNTFTEAHSAYRLTGAPPGYAGYHDPPILESVRHTPYTVFVFDELEKAHPEILKVFMSILDEGRCTANREDENGCRELDFRHCVFVFTSNAKLSAPARSLGFAAPCDCEDADPAPSSLSHAQTLAQRIFRRDELARRELIRSGVLSEIAGRFSGFILFQPLDTQARTAVTLRQIAALGREHGLSIAQIAPCFATALTPTQAHSPRSTVPLLEGILTPIFVAYAEEHHAETPLLLCGTVDSPVLTPLP